MAYCTVAEAKGSAIPALKFTQAGWTTDTPVSACIAEADAMINGRLASMGYDLTGVTASVPLVNQLSILYSRYAILRDIYDNRGPSQASNDGGGGKQYLDRFESLMTDLAEGRARLVTSTGAELTMDSDGVQNAADGVTPIFTMDDPENLSQCIPDEYIDDDIKGVP